jgi:hypothetical protein
VLLALFLYTQTVILLLMAISKALAEETAAASTGGDSEYGKGVSTLG